MNDEQPPASSDKAPDPPRFRDLLVARGNIIINFAHTGSGRQKAPAIADRDWLADIRDKVRCDWIRDVLRPLLGQSLPLKPRLAIQPGAVFNPLKAPRLQMWRDDSPVLPEETRLVELYDGADCGRHLVVLGKPGAGKSTELLRLAEDLLDRADADSSAPVPVVLQLSAWDPATDPLNWIVSQVSRRYQVPSARVEPWLREGRLVLLLDGLDEIASLAGQRDCVMALSALRTQLRMGMVVCCRTEDYRRIGQQLQFGLAVTVLPLAPDQRDRYLAGIGSALEPLRHAIADDLEIAGLLDTPLTLGAAARAYHGESPDRDMRTGDLDERLTRLWDRYVAAMLDRQRDPLAEFPSARGQLSPQAAYRHLVWLACFMRDRGRDEIFPDWFGSRWLPARPSGWPGRVGLARGLGALLGWQRTAALLVSLVFMLAIGVPVGLAYGLISGSGGALSSRLGYGLIYGFTGGLVGGAAYGLSEGLAIIQTVRTRWTRHRPVARYALGGLCCGLAYGLAWRAAATGLFGEPRLLMTDGPTQAVASGLLDGLFCGLVIRLIGGLSPTGEALIAENAREEWRWSWRDAGSGLLGGLCSGIAYGLSYGAGSGQVKGPAGAVVAGLVSALGLGVICGWQPDPDAPPTRPGQALRGTLRTYGSRIMASLLIAVILSVTLVEGVPRTFPAVIATGLSALVLAVVCKGVAPWIDHHMARSIAAWNGFLPRDLVAFLDYCEERILLRRSGGSYFFMHRALRDHLAACDPRSLPSLTPSERGSLARSEADQR